MCGRTQTCQRTRAGTLVCKSCLPLPRPSCARCGRYRVAAANWPIGPVCHSCYTIIRTAPGSCARCGATRPLIAGDTGGREAVWGSEGTTGLEAEVLLDGDLVGFVPQIPGSDTFDEAQIVDAIARADYDEPVGRELPEAPPPAPSLPREGGVFRRFLDGFRYDSEA